MGSKRSLAPEIAGAISDAHPNSAILDVFSGMCAVGSALAPQHIVFCNDVHAFAEVVAKAMFVSAGPVPTSLIARAELGPLITKNQEALTRALSERLRAEEEALARADDEFGWRTLKKLTEEEQARPLPNRTPRIPNIGIYRNDFKSFPYCLATRYFANGYFGLLQSIAIDSIRYAIDYSDSSRREFYLSALLQAISHCAAAPGHFAQFLVPRDRRNTRYIARIRRRDVVSRFYEAIDEIRRPACRDRSSNKVFRSDATKLLRENKKELSGISNLVIYADPPYSRAQYSRYYHVLETLVLYDYPECFSKGRYRDNRFNTDFSRLAKVSGAMDDFVSASAQTGAELYLSYPSNGLVQKAGDDLRVLIKKYYPKSEIIARVPLRHSTLGGAPGAASIDVYEEVHHGGWN